MMKERLAQLLGLWLLLFAINGYAVGMSDVKGGTSRSLSFESLSDNDVGGTAASGWSFQSANASPSAYKDAAYVSSATGTYTKSGVTFNFVSFTVSVSGRITASGPNPGPDTYSISANRNIPKYIVTTNADATPQESGLILPSGNVLPVFSFESMWSFTSGQIIGNKYSNWSLSPSTYLNTSAQEVTATPPTYTTYMYFGSNEVPVPLRGTFTISAVPSPTADNQSGSVNVTWVEVASVAATYDQTTITSTTDSPGTSETLFVPMGTNAFNITATPNPSGIWPSQKPTWTLNGSSVGTAGSTTYSFNPAIAGTYTIAAQCGNTKALKIVVVKVDVKLQYEQPSGTWNNISGTLYVLKGSTVKFKAIPVPAPTWPSGYPIWGGSASGSTETASVTFNTPSSSLTDYKTVTATCGNIKTANVVVYELTGTLTPVDNFTGRSQDRYGLQEGVCLGFTSTPAGITATQAGGLQWTYNGVGELTLNNESGTADYYAGNTAGNVTFYITVKSGPSCGEFRSYEKTVIAPSGTRLTRVNANVYHQIGMAGAGTGLYYWLDPKDVSFSNLYFGEGNCPSTAVSGFFLTCEPWNYYPNGTIMRNHPQNTFGEISGGNATTGCRVVAWDAARTGDANPYAAGSYTWIVPTHYIDDEQVRHEFGKKQNHVSTYQADGTAIIAKGGQSGTAALNDATSGW